MRTKTYIIWLPNLLIMSVHDEGYSRNASWRSVLLVEEFAVTGENQRPATSHWQTLSHNVVSSTPRH